MEEEQEDEDQEASRGHTDCVLTKIKTRTSWRGSESMLSRVLASLCVFDQFVRVEPCSQVQVSRFACVV